jgi:pimeloyl-ACP methyl ester carboxylesterase
VAEAPGQPLPGVDGAPPPDGGTGAPGAPRSGSRRASRQVVTVAGIPVSALRWEARQPRAVIVALHGGAASSGYFNAPGQPRLSLLRSGAALGFTVIALDRPGYGSSAPHAGRMTDAARRVDLAYAAVDRLLAKRPRGAGVLVLGHSMGCVLAVQMAADERGAGLLGLALAGIGREPQPGATALLSERARRGLAQPGSSRGGAAFRELIWGPGWLYPARAGVGISAAAPGYEGEEVRDWPGDFPALAAQVRIPVHYSLGDHERVWRAGPAGLADVAGLFTASPRVVTQEQADGGHNLSLGLSALAYHLKVLAFAEECVLTRARDEAGESAAVGSSISVRLRSPLPVNGPSADQA